MSFLQKQRYDVKDLLSLMELLRSDEGCPWDRKQTHQSIRRNFIEETYEVVEAIDREDAELLKEELGDVLLQVVFHAQMEKERGSFNFDDVCDTICKKLILRHPHIFADKQASTAEQVLENWEDIKKKEKHQETFTQTLQSVPLPLPALMRSEKVQRRAAKAGFDYPDGDWAMRDLHSELQELTAALDAGVPEDVEEELGDLIFSVVNVSRFAGVDAERALTKSCDKFIERFARVEQTAGERGIDMTQADIRILDNLWKEVKKQNKNFGGSKK